MRSALDDGDGSQLDALLGDAGLMARVHHLVHVLVGFGRLLRHQLGRCHADADALLGQVGQHLLVAELSSRRAAGQGPSCAVAGGTEGLLHALFRAQQHVGVGTHRPADQYGLACRRRRRGVSTIMTSS